jgi:hypothetical protein
MFPSLAPAEPCCWRIPRAVMNRRSAHVGELTLPPWHRVLWCGTHGWGFFSFVFLTREARGFVGGRWTARWGFRILNVGGEPRGGGFKILAAEANQMATSPNPSTTPRAAAQWPLREAYRRSPAMVAPFYATPFQPYVYQVCAPPLTGTIWSLFLRDGSHLRVGC